MIAKGVSELYIVEGHSFYFGGDRRYMCFGCYQTMFVFFEPLYMLYNVLQFFFNII